MNKYILYRVGLASDEEENQAADQEAELVAVEYGGDLDDVLEDLLRDVRDDLAGMDENAGCDVEAHGPHENYDQPPFDFRLLPLPAGEPDLNQFLLFSHMNLQWIPSLPPAQQTGACRRRRIIPK